MADTSAFNRMIDDAQEMLYDDDPILEARDERRSDRPRTPVAEAAPAAATPAWNPVNDNNPRSPELPATPDPPQLPVAQSDEPTTSDEDDDDDDDDDEDDQRFESAKTTARENLEQALQRRQEEVDKVGQASGSAPDSARKGKAVVRKTTVGKPSNWLKDESENDDDEDDMPAKTKKNGDRVLRKDGTPVKKSRPSTLRLLRNRLREQLRQATSRFNLPWTVPKPLRFRVSEQRIWKTIVNAASNNDRLPANVDQIIAKIEAKGGDSLQPGHMIFVTLFKAVEFTKLHEDLATLKKENDKLTKQVDAQAKQIENMRAASDRPNPSAGAPSAATATPNKRKSTAAPQPDNAKRPKSSKWPEQVSEETRDRRTLKNPRDRKLISAFDGLDELVELGITAIRTDGSTDSVKMKSFLSKAENRTMYDFTD
ncbi:hypothetical protein QTJ16_001985 [Diplocarpon rosae]|nr:hypothetical protein QTJ16_001985 [Diplocarpon rosae]